MGKKVTGNWSGHYGEIDPLNAPYVISGLGVADGYKGSGTARFAWRKRTYGIPDVIVVWCQRLAPWRYDLLYVDQRSNPRRGPRIPESDLNLWRAQMQGIE